MIKYVQLALVVCTGVLFFSQSLASGRDRVRVQSISPSRRVLNITTDKESLLSLVSGSDNPAPYISFPFVAEGNVSYTVQRQNPETITIGKTPAAAIDTAKGQPGIARAGFTNATNGIILKQLGIMRGARVYSLIVCPYDYNSAARELTYYKTVTVNLNSTQPFPIDFDKPYEHLSRKVVNKVQSSTPPPNGSYIRIVVNQDGIYHITGNDLDSAGVNISRFTSQNTTLWNRGKQIPIYIYTSGGTQFTKDSYFEFYGTPNRVEYSGGRPDLYLDPFTDNNVYFLTTDSTAPIQRLVTESGALGRVSNATDLSNYSFTQTAHLEQDNKFERLDEADLDQTYDKRDHWFWAEVSSNQMATTPFYLAYPDTTNIQPLTLVAAFHGITHLDGVNGSPNVPNEHQAELFINQTHVLSSTWDSQQLNIVNVGASANIPQNVLHHGANNFQIYDANSGDIAVAAFAFNWVELRYQRLYVADKDYIKFSIPDNAQAGYYNFLIQNFQNSSISVYRLNVSKISDITIKYLNNQGASQGYVALFQAYAQSPDDQFIAVSDNGKLKPVKIEQVPDAGLSSYDYSADYIIISSRELDDVTQQKQDPSNPVNQLASWYNSHGTKTLVVDDVQAYDDFNYGVKSPYAIKSFISYAYHNWSAAPKYVLLVGNGTWNTKNGGDASNLIPVMMMQTYTFGATAADNFYACVDGDDPIPDVAVGRIPASTTDQVKVAINKILSYYSNSSFGWQNTALLIAGEENTFHIQTDSIVHSMLPPNLFVKRLYTSIQNPAVDVKYYGVTQNLIDYFNQGALLVNYMGHGGGAIWADNGILTNDEVTNLSNSGKYPFVASMTCFTGAFDGQSGTPLSSTLLFAQNKGAVSVLASSGLGWLYNDFFLDGELIPAIFDSLNTDLTTGFDIILAKAQYYASYFFWPQSITMLNQYTLIGDPALKLQIAADNSTVSLDSYTTSAGQNVTGTVSHGPDGGTGTIQMTNLSDDVAAQASIKLDKNGLGTFKIQLPSGFAGQGHVKVYAYNNSSQSSSSADFSTASSFAQVNGFSIAFNDNVFRITVSALASSSSSINSLTFIGKIYASKDFTGDQFLAPLSIQLVNSAPNEYSGTALVGVDTLKPGELIIGDLEGKLSDGSIVASQQASYTVPGAADLSAFSRQGYADVNSSIQVVADSIVRLEATIYDWNSVPARNVRIDFYDGARGSGIFLGNTRVNFDTASQETASIPISLVPGNHTIYLYVVCDSLTNGYDLHPENNYAYNSVFVNIAEANSNGVITVDSSASLSGASPGQIFQIQKISPALYQQPFIIPEKKKNVGAQFYQFVSLRNVQSGNYTLLLRIYAPDSITNANLSALHIYTYDPRTRTLNLVGGNYADGTVTGTVNELGIFTAAFSTDHTPPQVTVSVGDQFFSDGDFVPPNPRFSFLIHDEDGVNLNKRDMDIQLDGQNVDTTLIEFPDTVANPTSVTATVQLSVKDGAHILQVSAEDANGNMSRVVSVNFVVRSDFSLRIYGAFPDPFVDRTFIAFEVTSGNSVNAVEVKIYSVSGRLIKTIRYPSNNPQETLGLLQGGTGSPTAVGYHEAWWDGTDNFGNQVANGVYFYKVGVNSGGKTLEDLGKLARLR